MSRVCPPVSEIIEAMEQVFRAKASGLADLPPKLGLSLDNEAFIHAMPASVLSLGAVGVKWISVFPRNAAMGMPQVCGLIILNDPSTGGPMAVLDAATITAERTGAASALAARFLARPSSETVGVLGCGIQARSHLRALSAEFPLRLVRAYDVSEQAAQLLVANIRASSGIEAVIADAPETAVRDSDIIVTAAPISRAGRRTIEAEWLAEGSCAISVDYVSLWTAEALAGMDVTITDDLKQLARARAEGYCKGLPEVDTELCDLVAGNAAGRTSDQQRTMALHLGIALEDVILARLIVDRAVESDVGVWLPI